MNALRTVSKLNPKRLPVIGVIILLPSQAKYIIQGFKATEGDFFPKFKAILEKNYDKKITDLYLVRLHPDAEEKNYELIKLPDLSVEIAELFEERRKLIREST